MHPGYPYATPEQHGLDAVTRWLVAFGFEAKFYVLFGFLFGYGLALQLGRSADGLGGRMARRLPLLFALGALHGVLLFSGDILMIYAIAGAALVLLRRVSVRQAVWLGVGLFGLVAAFLLLAVVTGDSGPGAPAADPEQVARNYRGGFAEVVGQRVADLAYGMSEWPVIVPIVLGYFLFGLAAGKAGLLHRRRIGSRALARACVVGALVGVPAAAVYASTSDAEGRLGLAMAGLGYYTAPVLTAAYAAGLLLLGRTRWGRRLHAALAPVGRLALTNYLGASLVCAVVFTGYGLALAGRVGLTVGVLVAVGIYLAQVPLSRWWSRRHAFGPAEWLLRSFTYLRRQPWRRQSWRPPNGSTTERMDHPVT
ncbi:uncharacterized protein SAMN05421810_103205 [Amycolatopsis arida]|uniref:DUF418 domain-containing protein n=1 Tax=Amycolatopsis arida TaxID=587909 RepID=A0A1I5SN32_9PSEU|nr:DUF418 domain-containing protein [Amycolatopsis arida]TDX96415.1 uncharacterized protein CLV69_103553 [Amycolatopsis arida]SFP72194.1 uncharacterized protein SAMN05421810_103205 [Amycolatopsis arida]